MTQLLARQNRHYRNTEATGLFGNIGMGCLVRFEVNFFHTLPQKPLKLVPFGSVGASHSLKSQKHVKLAPFGSVPVIEHKVAECFGFSHGNIL